ncbi:MAG TPA: hypothetical protein VMS18_07385 [Candidatus Binatia bacterium]|nr:hypothetical protein [Candidatus Binatia bacterium]
MTEATSRRPIHIPASLRLFAMVLIFISVSRWAAAQERVSLVQSFEIMPFVSYRSRMSLAIQPAVPGTNPHTLLDGSPGYGVGLGMRIREDDVIAVKWSRQDSYVDLQDTGVDFPRSRVILNQFHCDFTHEYVFRHRTPWLRPLIVASVGATNLSTELNSGSTYFSVGLGGGVKFVVSPHLGVRMQAQWLPIFIAHGTVVCGAGCVANLGGTLGSQAEVAVGPVLRF